MESRDFYANTARMATSVYEVLIELARVTPAEMTAGVVEVETMRVRMSPQHAKALAAMLVKHVREYERQYGVQLKVPDEMQALWNEIQADEK